MNHRRFNAHVLNEGRPSIHGNVADIGCNEPNASQKPDLTDFMTDMFFGSGEHNKAYSLNGGRHDRVDEFDSSTRSISSRQTQEWLQEAKRMVALSPARHDSPSRLVGSPRFGITKPSSSVSTLEKRDPLSRSARRHRAMEGFSGEILSRTAIHTQSRSEANSDPPQEELSSASDLQRWFSKVSNSSPDRTPPSSSPPLPPRQSVHRKSRFQVGSTAPASHPVSTPTSVPTFSPSRRNFKTPSNNGNGDGRNVDVSGNLVESRHRRSSSSCSVPEVTGVVLSPPRNLVESTHRRSISSSTCRTDRMVKKSGNNVFDGQFKDVDLKDGELNDFLEDQRIKIFKLMNGEIYGKAKVVLSGPSNSTSSMVAATCYAWLLENRMRAKKKAGAVNENNIEFVVPVMNIRRQKMWKQRQAAWLFHHTGLAATSLLFSNEVELETLMMAKQLSIVEVGQDILKTNGEVVSACTVLTDNYCEDAYDLLQTPLVKKLLLAGILLDTQNLRASPKLPMSRDAEAVQLLTVSSAPNYRNTLYDQLTRDQQDSDFFEVLSRIYGKPPNEIKWDNGEPTGTKIFKKVPSHEVNAENDTNDARKKKVSPASGKPTPSPGPAPAPAKTPTKASNDASRGKNKNFFAKLFGFGSK